MHTDCELGSCEKCDKEQAVIKAARAWRLQYKRGSNSVAISQARVNLDRALEALDSEEK